MTTSPAQLQVQHININELKASELNPRTWSDHQLAKLRESIEKFGVIDPLIINIHPSRKNIVVGGNMRLEVLRELGHTEVPVVELHLTERKERELNLRLNKTGDQRHYTGSCRARCPTHDRPFGCWFE